MGLCGPSANENTLQANEQSLSNTLSQDFSSRYAGQTNTLNTLNGILTPIAQAGPSQQGFSPQQLAVENTQAINSTGANYANASRALASRGAIYGGAGLTSGIQEAQQAALASGAAGELSNEQLGITNANYTAGRQNYENAVGGLNTLAGLQNPTPYASESTQANSQAFGQADKINQESQAGMKELFSAGLGALSGITGAFTGGGGGLASAASAGNAQGISSLSGYTPNPGDIPVSGIEDIGF
jgi:hypothetical protein